MNFYDELNEIRRRAGLQKQSKPTRARIAELARKLRNEYMKRHVCTAYQINNGLCDSYAHDLSELLQQEYGWSFEKEATIRGTSPIELTDLTSKEIKGWISYLRSQGIKIRNADDLTDLPSHELLYVEPLDMWFDAELPNGVKKLGDIPIYQKFNKTLR